MEISTVKQAVAEIRQLRNENRFMAGRLQMFDDLMTILRTAPANIPQGFSPDVVWHLEKEIEEAERENQKNEAKPR